MCSATCSVSEKIPCIFVTEALDLPESTLPKRPGQLYKVLASSGRLRPEAAEVLSSPSFCNATEKFDGTCCAVKLFNGRPWLWARYDRKPTKTAEKRFRAAMKTGGSGNTFTWNMEVDFKDILPNWIPASSGSPDSGGHIPGWLPVDLNSRAHCWHSSSVDFEQNNLALVLQPRVLPVGMELELVVERLENLVNCTLELIGTNINANPYKIGSRACPIHFLVRHGVFQLFDSLPLRTSDEFLDWFNTENGQVEGIVWHCANGKMFKLHRHHLGLRWPVERPRLLTLPVTINIEAVVLRQRGHEEITEFWGNKLFQQLSQISGQRFDSLVDIPWNFAELC